MHLSYHKIHVGELPLVVHAANRDDQHDLWQSAVGANGYGKH